MKPPSKGIEVRHQRACASRRGNVCDCKPTYRASVFDPKTKKLIRKTASTRAAAKQWREDARVDLRRGVLAPPVSPTIRTLAAAWLKGAVAGNVLNRSGQVYKPGVLRLYEQVLRDYVLPELGNTKIGDLRRRDVQVLVDCLVLEGLSPSTVRNAVMPLRALCRRAIVRGTIHANPTHGLELPAPRGPRDRIASPEQATQLLAALPAEDRAIWATALYAGLRLGELLALRWMDIDRGRSVIRVRRSWDRVEGPVAPKSAASLRMVPITGALDRHVPQKPQAADPTALVFGRAVDKPFSASGVVLRAHRLWEAVGLERMTPHECRHTFASLMIAAGVN